MFIPPCLPTASKHVPSGPEWVHEIKHDGYRLIVRRNGSRTRLYTRGGFNWAERFPRILQALHSLRLQSIVIDGEAVVCDEKGAADFDKLHSKGYDEQVVLYAFDLLELNGEDWRSRPLEQRKSKLSSIIEKAPDGIYYNEHLQVEGDLIFKHVCRMGLEGVVSKRRDFPYRSGRTKSWIKVKNPASPAMLRVKDGTW